MAITAQDIEAFIRQVDANPELKRALQERLVDAEAIQRALSDPAKRDEIRRLVLGDEWVDAPALLRELVATQREQAAILEKHTQQLAMLIETQQRHEAILQEHSRILQEHTQQLVMLIETQQRHEAILQEHSRILQEHTQQLAMLIETQQRHEAILREHSEMLHNHTILLVRMDERQNRLESLTHEIRDQVAGIVGQRSGEAHERQTIRRAMSIFRGGSGGSPERPPVQQRLRQWMRPLYENDQLPNAQDDPFLSDVIWWKGDKVVVGEISIKVDRLDVLRAKQRARTLRELGVDATPVVLGEEWAMDETKQLAQVEGVEWFVAGGFSQGLIEFRRLVDLEESEESL